MSKEDKQQEQAKNILGGGHLGGTNFGQQPGDANTTPKEGSKDNPKSGDKKAT